MMKRTKYSVLFPDRYREAMDGITIGMNIGYIGDRSISRTCINLSSATDDPLVENKVNELIMANVASGKTSRGHKHRPFHPFSISPIGSVPKKPSAGQVQSVTDIRVIHHLSHPHGGDSINNNSIDIHVKLSSFDEAMAAVVLHGAGCSLTKLDVKAAYKLVPVRFEDWHLLGFRWRGLYYYERTLPFGLKSSCRQWEVYATALHHTLVKEIKIPSVVHYVDDFLLVEKSKQDAISHLADTLALCDRLGLPIAHDKTEGPVTRLTFLGIQLDTITMTASLSSVKLLELQQLLLLWQNKRAASIEQLQSLAGKLNWACKVVRPGRSFLRRIIDHTSSLDHTHRMTEHKIPYDVRLDIKWWSDFAPQWNGISLLHKINWVKADKLNITTDACNGGYGARFGRRWIAGRWSPHQLATARNAGAKDTSRLSMPYLELLSLALAVATWAPLWSKKCIVFRSDCMPVVQAINRQCSSTPRSMAIIRHMHALAARYRFDFACEHIKGIDNVDADALSRGLISQFLANNINMVNTRPDTTASVSPN